MRCLSPQVEEMGTELERLRMENARMQHTQDVLERVLTVRDSAVAMLEAGKVGGAGRGVLERMLTVRDSAAAMLEAGKVGRMGWCCGLGVDGHRKRPYPLSG